MNDLEYERVFFFGVLKVITDQRTFVFENVNGTLVLFQLVS